MDILSDANGLTYIKAHADFLCKTMYQVMDAAKADALSYFFSEVSPRESFLLANLVRYRAKHYFEEMHLNKCVVENVLNNGIHLKFPESEYKIWKSNIYKPNATLTKSNYLTQHNLKQPPLPFEGTLNVYPLPSHRTPLRLVILWDLNAEEAIELSLVCPKSLTPDLTGVNPHWKLPIPRRTGTSTKQPRNTIEELGSNDLDLDLNDNTGSGS
ncbi:MAG: hypothetical protein ACJ8DI_13845 [Ktedonobacteraceae bacterium]